MRVSFLTTEAQRAMLTLERALDVHGDCCEATADPARDLLRELRRMEERYRAGIPIVVQVPEKEKGEGGL